MYVRLKTNRSGSTTVVVVEKKAGRQVYVKSIGTSSNPEEIAGFTKAGELDRLLKNNKMGLSVDTVLSIAKTIPTIKIKVAEGSLARTLFLTKRQQLIKPLFEEKFWVTQTDSENQ